MLQDAPHFSFVLLEQVLADHRPASAAFDPASTWTSSYRLHAYTAEIEEQGSANAVGELRLERTSAEGGAALSVGSTARYPRDGARGGLGELRLHATARCRDDALSTLVAWRRVTEVVDARGRPDPALRSEQEGTLESWLGARKRSGEEVRLTSDWTLIDALQRLPPSDEPWRQRFELLEELERWRPEQRLERIPPTEVRCAGEPVRLHGFVRLGRATPPVHYWLDGNRRVLFVIGATWALVWTGSNG